MAYWFQLRTEITVINYMASLYRQKFNILEFDHLPSKHKKKDAHEKQKNSHPTPTH